MNPFECYTLWIALKQHFSSNYDYFKYNGKTHVNISSFEKRNDKYYFHKLSKKEDVFNLILSNILEDNCNWIGDLFTDKAEQIHKNYIKRKESLTYLFKEDMKKIFPEYKEKFLVNDGQHPLLLKMLKKKDVMLETLIILNDNLNYLDYWNKKIEDNILWPIIKSKIMNYKPFIKYDEKKFRNIILETIKDYK